MQWHAGGSRIITEFKVHARSGESGRGEKVMSIYIPLAHTMSSKYFRDALHVYSVSCVMNE